MKNAFTSLLCGLLFACLLSGCYNRFTRNYNDLPELNEDINAMLETPTSEQDEEERIRYLEALENDQNETYTINSGDKVAICVYNHSDIDVKTIVTPDGYIGMMFVGQVKVAGLTLEQAARAIEEKLAKYIRNPEVGISPYEIHSETATIAGSVVHPGMYPLSHGMRLADLLALAGGGAFRYYDGRTLDATDYERSLFIRKGKIIPVDFTKAINTGLPPHNILLRKGDYVFIALREENMVHVIGDVQKPYRQMWSKNIGVLELLSNAGWVNETHWSHVIIIRGSLSNPKMYKVDLDGILAGKKPNVRLAAGDILYVPRDDISEYNVFIRKLLPTGQLIQLYRTALH
jgi:polysaccharide export outer membrane protein